MQVNTTLHGSTQTGTRKPLALLAALAATLAAGYGVMFTLIGDYRDRYGISESTLGWIIGIGFIVGFLSQVTLGPLGDRGYARRLIYAAVLANAIGMLMMGFGTSSATILIGRVITGLAAGAASPAIKRLVIASAHGDTGRQLGWLFSAEVFGFASGPVISAIFVRFGLATPYLVIAAISLVIWAVSTQTPLTESAEAETRRFAFDLLRQRTFAGAVMLGAAGFMMIGAFDALWDVVHTDLGTAEWVANLGIALFAIPLVLLGPLSGSLAQRIGPFRVAAAGLTVAAAFMFVYGMMASGIAIFAITMIHAVTDGCSFAASGVAVAMTAPEQRQSGAQGVLGGMQSLSAGIMAPITGWLYQNHGQRAAYWMAAGTILAMVVVGLALAGPGIGQIREAARPPAKLSLQGTSPHHPK